MGYDYVSDAYITQVLNKNLYKDLQVPCYNLSAILADVDGKISSGVMLQLVPHLNMTSPGLIMQGNLIAETLMSDTYSVLPVDPFIPEVTRYSYELFRQLVLNDPLLVSETQRKSRLIDFSKYKIEGAHIQTALYTLYMDLFAVYKSMLSANMEVANKTTLFDLDKIINNIRSISTKLEAQEEKSYDFIQILRDAYITLMFLRHLPDVFNRGTYLQQVQEYRVSRGESRNE